MCLHVNAIVRHHYNYIEYRANSISYEGEGGVRVCGSLHNHIDSKLLCRQQRDRTIVASFLYIHLTEFLYSPALVYSVGGFPEGGIIGEYIEKETIVNGYQEV